MCFKRHDHGLGRCLVLLLAIAARPASAQDGAASYSQYCASCHDQGADRAPDRADRGDEEEHRFHQPPFISSPSFFSGVRSIGSASSISLVKIRSERS